MNYYDGYWGMNLLWWFFWIMLIALFFFTPWRTKRTTRSTLLHTLRKTYAEGKISTQDYEERKSVLEKEFLVQRKKDTNT